MLAVTNTRSSSSETDGEWTVPRGNERQWIILVGTFDPALSIKDVFLAEHALAPEKYPESGLNVPYVFLIIKRYGNLVELERSGSLMRIAGPFMRLTARMRGLQIPDEPLPIRGPNEGPFLRLSGLNSDANARRRSKLPEIEPEERRSK